VIVTRQNLCANRIRDLCLCHLPSPLLMILYRTPSRDSQGLSALFSILFFASRY
jgi:hypothetical protein